MTPAAGDLHASDPARRGAEFARDTLQGLEALGVHCVVVGGWAVRALGSPIPSIDLDILIPAAARERQEVYDFIEGRTWRRKAGQSDAYLEVDTLEGWNPLWHHAAGYRPAELLARTGTARHEVRLAGITFGAEAPRADALAVMKLKALRDRSAQLAAVLDPVRLARLPDEARDAFEGVRDPVAFLRRKAGKDLADVAFLCGREAPVADVTGLVRSLGMGEPIAAALEEMPRQVAEEARGLLTRFEVPVDIDGSVRQLRETMAA